MSNVKTRAATKNPAEDTGVEDDGGDLRTLILSIHKQISDQIQNVGKQVEELKAEVLPLTHTLTKKNEDLEKEVSVLKNTITSLQTQINDQSEKIIALEIDNRKKNLIFYGISQDGDENCELKIKKLIAEVMQIDDAYDIKFEKCHRIGKSQPRALLCQFNCLQDRERVFKAKKHLAKTAISISEDFPLEVLKRRRILYPFMKYARTKDQFSVLRDDRLIIGDKSYTVDTIDTIDPAFDPANTCTKQYGEVIAFFGGSSPLSNFFNCELTIKGKLYYSVEQYFQHQKCLFAENPVAANKVISTKKPGQCKKIGDALLLQEDEWLPTAQNVMYEAMRAKFTQNKRARDFLANTGGKTLAEATRDNVWGTGLKFEDKDNGIVSKWSGKNIAGSLLMRIRHELCAN